MDLTRSPLIDVRRVAKRYADPTGAVATWALTDVSFSIAAGDTTGVLGRNGAGLYHPGLSDLQLALSDAFVAELVARGWRVTRPCVPTGTRATRARASRDVEGATPRADGGGEHMRYAACLCSRLSPRSPCSIGPSC